MIIVILSLLILSQYSMVLIIAYLFSLFIIDAHLLQTMYELLFILILFNSLLLVFIAGIYSSIKYKYIEEKIGINLFLVICMMIAQALFNLSNKIQLGLQFVNIPYSFLNFPQFLYYFILLLAFTTGQLFVFDKTIEKSNNKFLIFVKD